MEPHGAQVQNQIKKMENCKKVFSIYSLFFQEILMNRCQIRIQREILHILIGSNIEKLDF